ncbi:hypothetical protein MMC25_003449 [Agyrium rufum]|nr:hypothetical protein [Agyrium rufum]
MARERPTQRQHGLDNKDPAVANYVPSELNDPLRPIKSEASEEGTAQWYFGGTNTELQGRIPVKEEAKKSPIYHFGVGTPAPSPPSVSNTSCSPHFIFGAGSATTLPSITPESDTRHGSRKHIRDFRISSERIDQIFRSGSPFASPPSVKKLEDPPQRTSFTFRPTSSIPQLPEPGSFSLLTAPSQSLHTPTKSMSSEGRTPDGSSPFSTSSNEVQPRSGRPEFGKPSALQSPLKPKSVFNMPKSNRPRPEHHRPATKSKPPDIISIDSSPAAAQSSQSRRDRALQDDGIYEITPPAQPLGQGFYPARASTMYSSNIGPRYNSNIYNPYTNPYAAVAPAVAPNVFGQYEDFGTERFGAEDPMAFMDSVKANENIKALLEGAFEDEEDKPRTRGQKKTVERRVEELTSQLGDMAVGKADNTEPNEGEEDEEPEDDGTLEGLKVKLLPHQRVGVDWMVDKERSRKKKRGVLPKGGILADDMGLGKTIQSIALILSNTRPTDSAKGKDGKPLTSDAVGSSTLVVAPLALIKQWEAEIKEKVEESHTLRVLVHHGPKRTTLGKVMKKYNVVITTYQTLVSEFDGTSKDHQTGCFDVHWYRVILDEAHSIKNRNAKSTKACCALRSEYRWCLTGTPMQNNLDELQSLIHFLRIKPYDDLSTWKDQITQPMNAGRGGIAMKRLQIYLKAFMKRRTKDVLRQDGALSKGVGKSAGNEKGLKLVERRVEDVVVELEESDRLFYDRLEARAGERLDDMMGDSKMSYASALVLLLRLRQACNHPKLVGGAMADDTDALETGKMGAQASSLAKSIDNELDDIAGMMGGLTMQTKKCDVCQAKFTKEEVSSGSVRCHACDEDLALTMPKAEKKHQSKTHKHQARKHIKQERGDREDRRTRVAKNRRIVDSDDEDDEIARKPTNLGDTDDENEDGEGDTLGVEDSDTDDEEVRGPSKLRNHRDRAASDDSDSEGEDDDSIKSESDSNTDSTSDSDALTAPKIATSTKIKHLMTILNRESAKHKFIIFSQFTSMLDLIEPILNSHFLTFTRYDGKMKNDAREASLHRLRTDSSTRILLCSLKCGSLGLNLTAASRVVILEPFWNPFVEEQAIDRVHRLNQTEDVVVYKITAANSVEERILELQEKKRALASQAIEGKMAVSKLTMQDLLKLFRKDAEHDERHGRLSLEAKARVNGGIIGRNGNGNGMRAAVEERVVPNERSKGGFAPARLQDKKVPDAGAYARRW